MDKIELERIHKEWQDKKIPDFAEKEEFVSYLAQMFLSTQMKNFGLNSYIENYVNTHFTKYKNRNWAVAIKTIRENYKFFRLLGWTEKNLNMIYNDYKAGLYDDYFDEV